MLGLFANTKRKWDRIPSGNEGCLWRHMLMPGVKRGLGGIQLWGGILVVMTHFSRRLKRFLSLTEAKLTEWSDYDFSSLSFTSYSCFSQNRLGFSGHLTIMPKRMETFWNNLYASQFILFYKDFLQDSGEYYLFGKMSLMLDYRAWLIFVLVHSKNFARRISPFFLYWTSEWVFIKLLVITGNIAMTLMLIEEYNSYQCVGRLIKM